MADSPTDRLHSYQETGTNWICQQLRQPDTRAVLLCDDPGLGKTVQALSAADRLGARRIIVAAPAGARRVWAVEISRWFPDWRDRVLAIEPGTKIAKAQPLLTQDELIVLISYDALSEINLPVPWAGALARHAWDLLIVDEAHYLKGLSNRTRAVYGERGSTTGLHAACQRVLLLTGTPTPNHAGELFHHIRALWPGVLSIPNRDMSKGQPLFRAMTEAEFQERVTEFRDTKWGRQILRSKNQPWLRERLAGVVLHRSKAKVLPELPPVITQDVPLGVSSRLITERLTPPIRRLAHTWALNTRSLPDDEFVSQLQQSAHGDLGPLTQLRRNLGELKVQAAAEWIAERLECGTRKMLVFGWHISVLEHLHRALAPFDPVLVTGETRPIGRANAVELFQHRASVRVFVGQILAAGTAITLTAASEVAIVEPSWVPGENRQAISRAHRLGQKDSVLASFLYVPGTLDERIMAVFRRKAADIAQLLPEQGEVQAHAEAV